MITSWYYKIIFIPVSLYILLKWIYLFETLQVNTQLLRSNNNFVFTSNMNPAKDPAQTLWKLAFGEIV